MSALPQRKVRLYEVYARLRAGDGVPHARRPLHGIWRRRSICCPAIDNLLLLRCLQMLRGKAGRDPEAIPYVLNITSATLNDRGFMGDLVAFLSQYRSMAARLIFELRQKDFDEMADTVGPGAGRAVRNWAAAFQWMACGSGGWISAC